MSSPDGSYTEDHSVETQFKSRSTEFDDEFDDEDPLPTIGTCKALYPFEGRVGTHPTHTHTHTPLHSTPLSPKKDGAEGSLYWSWSTEAAPDSRERLQRTEDRLQTEAGLGRGRGQMEAGRRRGRGGGQTPDGGRTGPGEEEETQRRGSGDVTFKQP